MAIIRVLSNTNNIELNNIDGVLTSHSPVAFTVTAGNETAYFSGQGFVFDAQNYLVSGLITGLVYSIGAKPIMSITGLHTAAEALIGNPVPDIPLLRYADTFYGNSSHDSIDLCDGADIAYGMSGNDSISGGGGRDNLFGGTGNDTLKGDMGFDTLTGGMGRDTLYGGMGGDRFVFNSIYESKPGASQRDTIVDFRQYERDKIDLSAIDANGNAQGHGNFTFIGSHAFSGTRGELHYVGGILSGDVNGDAKADFEISVANSGKFTSYDFIL